MRTEEVSDMTKRGGTKTRDTEPTTEVEVAEVEVAEVETTPDTLQVEVPTVVQAAADSSMSPPPTVDVQPRLDDATAVRARKQSHQSLLRQ